VFDAGRLKRAFPTVVWPEVADVLAESFWPGPLTLVLDDGSTSGLAVRAESHPATRAILERWDGALGSTSLNRSGAAPARTLEEARGTLRAMADPGRSLLLVAAGDLAGPPPSTLLSLRGGELRLLREGAVDRSMLEQVLGRSFDG
jgi:L-threonylcarbamoyladenylate synthase